jgi:hypothetical protein
MNTSVTLRLVLAGSLMLSVTSSLQAQNSTLLNNSLLPNGTSFRTTTAQNSVTCNGTACNVPLFNPGAVDVTCMTGSNNTCILYIQIDANIGQFPDGASGYFSFLVDGKPASPGPTVAFWGFYQSLQSFAVVAQVTGGMHYVQVNFGCVPVQLVYDGPYTCIATSSRATLKVAAYTP